jgi:anti-anti-sigma regulatory factor
MMAESKNVGLFLVLPAPLNPIGAFDAETFKARFRDVMEERADAKFIGVDLSGIDFVYSDAYNAFMQFHQELSKRNGTFAVLADRESLAKSLKKVGLERLTVFS